MQWCEHTGVTRLTATSCPLYTALWMDPKAPFPIALPNSIPVNQPCGLIVLVNLKMLRSTFASSSANPCMRAQRTASSRSGTVIVGCKLASLAVFAGNDGRITTFSAFVISRMSLNSLFFNCSLIKWFWALLLGSNHIVPGGRPRAAHCCESKVCSARSALNVCALGRGAGSETSFRSMSVSKN
jgi:hypothetical protein